MSVEQWYSFSLLMARHLNMEKVIYRVSLSSESFVKRKEKDTCDTFKCSVVKVKAFFFDL